MTANDLIQKLRQLPDNAEVRYLLHADDYHGDTYFEPISAENALINGLFSSTDGKGRGALLLVSP
jgi:hypothetical protein